MKSFNLIIIKYYISTIVTYIVTCYMHCYIYCCMLYALLHILLYSMLYYIVKRRKEKKRKRKEQKFTVLPSDFCNKFLNNTSIMLTIHQVLATLFSRFISRRSYEHGDKTLPSVALHFRQKHGWEDNYLEATRKDSNFTFNTSRKNICFLNACII